VPGTDPRHDLGSELALRTTQYRRHRAADGNIVAADQFRKLVGVGGTAKKSKERDVEHLGKLFFGETETIAERKRDQACPQPLFKGLTHPEVSGQRKRGHERGEAQPLCHLGASC
jgi:hypothetical protein